MFHHIIGNTVLKGKIAIFLSYPRAAGVRGGSEPFVFAVFVLCLERESSLSGSLYRRIHETGKRLKKEMARFLRCIFPDGGYAVEIAEPELRKV